MWVQTSKNLQVINNDNDLWLPDLPPLVFEAVPPLAVNHPDAVEGANNQQGPSDADADRGQHPRHVTSLAKVETQRLQ